MGQPIRNLPVGSWVKDTATLINGKIVKWKILDHNHSGYPTNTTTLMGVPDQTDPVLVSPQPSWNNSAKSTFRDFSTTYKGMTKTIGEILDELYQGFSQGLKNKIVDTPLDIGYSGSYTGSSARTRKETHRIFLFGAKEMNHGSSTYLNGANSQVYFPQLSAFNNSGINIYMNIDSSIKVMSRDIAISSSDYYTMFPGYLNIQQGYSASSTIQMQILPMINISSDTMVKDQQDGDTYILDLSQRLGLIEKDGEILKWDASISNWVSVGNSPATEDMFLNHGIADFSVIPKEKWKKLNNQFDILCYSDVSDLQKIIIKKPKSVYNPTEFCYKGYGVIATKTEILPKSRRKLQI